MNLRCARFSYFNENCFIDGPSGDRLCNRFPQDADMKPLAEGYVPPEASF